MEEEVLSTQEDPAELNKANTSEEKEPVISEEEMRLGSRPPLKTLIILSVGPLISQITGSLYGIVNTVWVSKAIGDKGMTAISTYNNFDTIGRAFAIFLQVAASAKISALFGTGKADEAAQLFSDLLRMSILCAIIAAVGFLPWCRAAARWFGASDEIIELGYEYIFPNLMSTIVPCIYLLGCGCLQAEGRSWLFTIVQVGSLIANMCILAPFFMFACHTGIAGVAYSTIVAELVPGIVLIIMFYMGKFGIKPKVSDLLKKPSHHIWSAAQIGFSQLLYQLSLALPGLFMRYFFGQACDSEAMFNDVMAGFNTFCRFWVMVTCVTTALTMGYLPAAGYAYGAKRFERITKLLIHTTWISISWSLFAMIFTVGFPRLLCLTFSDSEGYLEWGELIVRRANLVSFCLPVPIITAALLQSLQHGGLASCLSFITQTIPLPVISAILFFTGKDNLPRLIYGYPIQYGFSAVVAIPFALYAVRKIWKRPGKDIEVDLVANENDVTEL